MLVYSSWIKFCNWNYILFFPLSILSDKFSSRRISMSRNFLMMSQISSTTVSTLFWSWKNCIEKTATLVTIAQNFVEKEKLKNWD